MRVVTEMPDGRKTKVETNGFKTLKDIAPASAVGCYDHADPEPPRQPDVPQASRGRGRSIEMRNPSRVGTLEGPRGVTMHE